MTGQATREHKGQGGVPHGGDNRDLCSIAYAHSQTLAFGIAEQCRDAAIPVCWFLMDVGCDACTLQVLLLWLIDACVSCAKLTSAVIGTMSSLWSRRCSGRKSRQQFVKNHEWTIREKSRVGVIVHELLPLSLGLGSPIPGPKKFVR